MILTTEQLNQQSSSKQFESNIELTARSVLLRALIEKRVICGISSAIQCLSQSSDNSIFCFLATPQQQDSATNMNQTLLEAFCYENDIYVVRVDSAEKLSRILGTCIQHTCALIQKTWTHGPGGESVEHLTDSEMALVDYCELNWDSPQNQNIHLPG